MLRLDCPGLQHDKIPRSNHPLAIYACGAKLSPHTQLPIGLIAAYRTPILCPFDLSQSGLQLLYPFLLLLNRLPKTLLRLLPGGYQAVLAVKMRRELLKRGQRGRKGVVRGRDGVSGRKEGVLTSARYGAPNNETHILPTSRCSLRRAVDSSRRVLFFSLSLWHTLAPRYRQQPVL